MRIRSLTISWLLCLSFVIFNYNFSLNAQTLDGEWQCDYATTDESTNGTGYNVPSIAVLGSDTFVALVWRASSNNTNYLVGYRDADSTNGRLGEYAYGSAIAGYEQSWIAGFDAAIMHNAAQIAGYDDMVFVANNDNDRNVLVFTLGEDSVESAPYRMVSGADSLWAINVDGNGRVYVASIKDSVTASEILVFGSVTEDAAWGALHISSPMTTITMPSPGTIRGITTNSDGTVLYASNYDTKEIYCYTGSPEEGYTLYDGFSFTLDDPKLTTDSTETLVPGPWGLGLMEPNNILFVAADVNFQTGTGYEYGKIFLLNPNNAEILDTIDVAEWNLEQTGAYNNRPGGTVGNVSGYTSTYDVDFADGYLYSQSHYGWTVEKWSYSGELPVIPLDVVSVEREENVVPKEFNLSQNYPNPFNPTTTIEFSITEKSTVNLAIYTVNGELVSTIINSTEFSGGTYKVTFDASKLASGTYIYTLKNDARTVSKKMTLIK